MWHIERLFAIASSMVLCLKVCGGNSKELFVRSKLAHVCAQMALTMYNKQ
jgi:hypothetical protein